MMSIGQQKPGNKAKSVDGPYVHALRSLEGTRPITVLTGATGGIGGEVARALAMAGHALVLPGRSPERNEARCRELTRSTGNPDVFWVACDLSSLPDVRRAAEKIRAAVPHVDVLVNNAGVFGSAEREMVDGLERHLVVNYLAAFTLTHLLLPSIERAGGRIVNVAGETARIGRIRLNDLNRDRGYSVLSAYAQTKLALICFTATLAERLQGGSVSVSSLTPGIAGTDHLAGAASWLSWLWSRMPGPARAGRAVTRRVLSDPKPGAPYYVGTLRMLAPLSAYRRTLRDALYAKSAELVGLDDRHRLVTS